MDGPSVGRASMERGERHVSYMLDLDHGMATSRLGNGVASDSSSPPLDFGSGAPAAAAGAAGAAAANTRKQKMQAAKSSVAVRKVGRHCWDCTCAARVHRELRVLLCQQGP